MKWYAYHKGEILSKSTYDSYVKRGPFVVCRKGGGKVRPALIEWRSLHAHYRDRIIARYGNPEVQTQRDRFMRYLERDAAARGYYAAFQLQNGAYLPERTQLRYAAEAAVLNAVGAFLRHHSAPVGSSGVKAIALWSRLADWVSGLERSCWPHDLPTHPRSLRRKLERYRQGGYPALIHKNFCNKNSEKIHEAAEQWLIAQSQLLKAYKQEALKRGWKLIFDEKTLYNFLYDEKVKGLWYGYRYGELKAEERHLFQFTTRLPELRDALWYGGGTRLNYFYRDASGKPRCCQVYEVMDAYSEVLLGYHIGEREDFAAQRTAYEMAVETSGYRPYRLGMDHQGGHNTAAAQAFFEKISQTLSRPSPIYGKSKSIESAFGRFQAQYLAQDWFFSGQDITAVKLASRPNLEFLEANRAELPSLAEIKACYAHRRQQCNQALHPKKGISRLQLYQQSTNSQAPAVSPWERVDWFWVLRPTPVTSRAYGIRFTEGKVTYDYIVHTPEGYPDQKWLCEHIGVRFRIRYDPDDRSQMYLYRESSLGLRFAARAETKVAIHRALQEQEAWESDYIQKVGQIKKRDRLQVCDTVDQILSHHNMRPEDHGLRSPALKGINKAKSGKKTPSSKAESQPDLNIYHYM